MWRQFSMFSRCILHTSMPMAFCYMLKLLVWMGLLLIAAGMCFAFIILANQEMVYWQTNQNRSLQFQVVDIPHWPISAHYSSCWMVSFNRPPHGWTFTEHGVRSGINSQYIYYNYCLIIIIYYISPLYDWRSVFLCHNIYDEVISPWRKLHWVYLPLAFKYTLSCGLQFKSIIHTEVYYSILSCNVLQRVTMAHTPFPTLSPCPTLYPDALMLCPHAPMGQY